MSAPPRRLDLCGVKCPLNWAKAKVRLEYLAPGDQLELVIDDPKGRRDIPRAAEAEGYAIVEVSEPLDSDTPRPPARRQWRIVIEK